MRIFVGCSSREEVVETYAKVAVDILPVLQNQKIVLGGSLDGLMRVIGSGVPRRLLTQVYLREYYKEDGIPSSQVIIKDSSFERLQEIWNLSDCFLFLPGGTGTVSEFFSFLEENRTSKCKKILCLFNYEGFFDDILAFLHQAKEKGFSDDAVLQSVRVVNCAMEFKDLLEKEGMNI